MTPVRQLSSTAMNSRPRKISPVLSLPTNLKAGTASTSRPRLPASRKGLRPTLSLAKPTTGCTNSMPIMTTMMISTPCSSEYPRLLVR
ncbi:hypothetical protein G6F22_021533 [Rhizopus arrhizus]|nr:hypothetical protein G6F22_021533 [Rhizopus arrhizus]